MITLILILIAVAWLLLTFEVERMIKAKRRRQTSKLLDYIAGLNPQRTYRLESNAAGNRWQD